MNPVAAATLFAAAAMGGPGTPSPLPNRLGPVETTAWATAACSKRMAQLAARHGIKDLTSQVIGYAQHLSDGRYLVRLAVTITYRRKPGIENRHAIIGCVVNEHGKVDYIDTIGNK